MLVSEYSISLKPNIASVVSVELEVEEETSHQLNCVSIAEIVKNKILLCPFCHRMFDHFKERNNHRNDP